MMATDDLDEGISPEQQLCMELGKNSSSTLSPLDKGDVKGEIVKFNDAPKPMHVNIYRTAQVKPTT